MKIAIVCPVFIEGLEYQENILVRYYEKFGHEVHVITSTFHRIFDYLTDRYDASAPRQTTQIGRTTIHRLRYRINFKNRLRAFEGVEPLLNEIQPDLIFLRDITPDVRICTRYVRRHPASRMILDFHGDFSNSANGWLSKNVLHRVIRRRLLAGARPYLSRIFPVTPGSADFMRQLYGVRDDEMEILPLGADVDMGERVKASGAREQLRKQYGIADDVVVIFTGGKFTPEKRTHDLVNAFKRLPRGRAHLIIIGDASEKNLSYKQQLVALCEGRDDIRFTGWLNAEDVFRHLAASDLAVFPASQSIVWQQSIAMGLPLVVNEMSNSLQSVGYLNLHDNIYVLEPKEPLEDVVYEAVRKLVDSPALLAQMSAGAAETTKEMLDWNTLIYRTLRFNN